ncbi:hypothetical protein [Fundidesulfovibrio terrae]|uniref:hypothetical protein n=1 Tax=Fundidesulfovibrio terrae TaxID=2922866 RepID=UPI001FAFAD58|nr:hypothetical protein [Fundidesulfovibrio terrae]
MDASINDFFTRVFEDILAGRVTLESIMVVLAFFGSFILLTSLAFVFSKKPREVMLDHPATWVTEYPRIMELLDAAVVQRSKVRVSFHRDLGGARSSDGTLIDANKNDLTLEMSSIKTINPAWVGRTLELNFMLRLPDQPKILSTFSFISEILSYHQGQNDILQFKISRPLRLELNQNRMHLRVEPPAKYVRSLKLWTEDDVRHNGDPRDPDSWGDALYSAGSEMAQEIEMDNISGGGMRVEIVPGALRAKNNKIAVNQQYYGQFTLADPEFTGFTTHYVLMRVVKCYDDCDSKTKLSLGLIFSAMGVPNEPPLTGLKWRTVNRDFGIRELDDWAYELHLELYRNKGIA